MVKVSNEVIQLNGHPDVQGTESNDQTCSLRYKMINISTKSINPFVYNQGIEWSDHLYSLSIKTIPRTLS